MFYKKYLSDEEIDILLSNYTLDILKCIDNDNANKIIEILNKHNIDFINDLIINYIELFVMKPSNLELKLNLLKKELGNEYINYIENNLYILVN